MNSLSFSEGVTNELLADLDAMKDFIDIVKTPEVDAVRPRLEAALAQARRLLLLPPSEPIRRSPVTAARGRYRLATATAAVVATIALTWLLAGRRR